MLHLNLTTLGCLAAHTYTADAIRRHGTIPSIEISHSGQYAGTYLADKAKKASLCQYGPSDGVRPDGKPAALRPGDIKRHPRPGGPRLPD